MKKVVVLIVIALFIGVSCSTAISVDNKTSAYNNIQINDNKNNEESNVEIIKQQGTGYFLPDLAIKDINYYAHDPGSPFYYIEADIKNQGFGYLHDEVTVEFKIVNTIFWLFNIDIIYENTETEYFYGGLAPGETRTIFLYIGEPNLPFFGFLKFDAGINLDKKIEERNYFNNRHIERVFCIFGMLL